MAEGRRRTLRLARAALLGLGLGLALSGAADEPSGLDEAERRALRLELSDVLASGDDGLDRFDAEVWLAALDPHLARFLPNAPEERLRILGIVWQEARRHDLDPELALAVMEIESSFNRYAISRVGAQGLMQVMPFWKAELGRDDDNLTEPVTNVRYGMTILAHYLEREQGDAVKALTRYHGDRRDLSYPAKVFRAWNARWRTRPRGEVRALMASCYRARLDTCDPG
ncbi:MAG: transglycosylase SLT domain-containing protein [Pseudomonadales bacterium]|jgi:soluble lytic murein transglycosylase-like protein|nr:transglycosylase SLT domain-containing protein [Pseudomonadales bacterium]